MQIKYPSQGDKALNCGAIDSLSLSSSPSLPGLTNNTVGISNTKPHVVVLLSHREHIENGDVTQIALRSLQISN